MYVVLLTPCCPSVSLGTSGREHPPPQCRAGTGGGGRGGVFVWFGGVKQEMTSQYNVVSNPDLNVQIAERGEMGSAGYCVPSRRFPRQQALDMPII